MTSLNTSDVEPSSNELALISVLGPPGAGKGTLSSYLTTNYPLLHYSVGDSLRDWMHANRGTALAAAIQDKLDNQGFLSAQDLNPFIAEAIRTALEDPARKIKGILIDGYPRCVEQLASLDDGAFKSLLPHHDRAPDLVLATRLSKASAQARYVGRRRDSRDSLEKFEKRFAEYESETSPVLEVYREREILIEIDADGSKEENIRDLERRLGKSEIWRRFQIESY